MKIAIGIEPSSGHWMAYGAADLPDEEAIETVRDMLAGREADLYWLTIADIRGDPLVVDLSPMRMETRTMRPIATRRRGTR